MKTKAFRVEIQDEDNAEFMYPAFLQKKLSNIFDAVHVEEVERGTITMSLADFAAMGKHAEELREENERLRADVETALDLLLVDHVYPTALRDGRYLELTGHWALPLGRLAAKYGRFQIERNETDAIYGRFVP